MPYLYTPDLTDTRHQALKRCQKLYTILYYTTTTFEAYTHPSGLFIKQPLYSYVTCLRLPCMYKNPQWQQFPSSIYITSSLVVFPSHYTSPPYSFYFQYYINFYLLLRRSTLSHKGGPPTFQIPMYLECHCPIPFFSHQTLTDHHLLFINYFFHDPFYQAYLFTTKLPIIFEAFILLYLPCTPFLKFLYFSLFLFYFLFHFIHLFSLSLFYLLYFLSLPYSISISQCPGSYVPFFMFGSFHTSISTPLIKFRAFDSCFPRSQKILNKPLQVSFTHGPNLFN